ncbi:ABC-type Fe3+ transport system, permease component [Longilinea arvoryzae]|uniref:ABC-type Fe3+ transport system, permease component n=1 Tax=Longilinea arvoryzae TaxID=360412 RepID=A0A0S7BEE1_9CHLR|nr:iron ABC transporter permease [Longilinea arvoryzae]GAP13817.1 ABC-type Fe3+ transport system, permease component [Longilinea arvoryzae]
MIASPKRFPRAVWLWSIPLLFLGVFFFLPLGTVFHLAFQPEMGGVRVSRSDVLQPLGFTFWQAGLSTLLTLVVGLPAAYLFARFEFPGKRLLRVLTTLPFILPTVVVAASFNALLGPRGWINLLLMDWFGLATPPIQILNILGAILLAHVFYNTTVVIRVVGSALGQLDPRLEQAARVLGASPLRTLREVTLPLLRPALLSATLLVFLFDFTSFGVVLLLGGPRYATLEVEIYIQALQMLNLPLAGLLSAVQLACTLAISALNSRLSGKRAVPLAPRLRGEGIRKPRTWRERLLVGSLTAVLVALLVMPLAALGLRSVARLEGARGERGAVQNGLTLDYYRELFINRRGSLFYVPPIEAARNSLIYAGTTVVIALSLGSLAAAALSQRSKINRWLEPLLLLPLGASAVTLGLGFIVAFNKPPLDSRSFPLLVPIAHSLVALPFVVRTLQPAMASIPQSLKQAAAVLGASPLRAWLEVDLPIIARAALVSAVFSFTISLGEFGATSFIAQTDMPTLPVAIYRFLSQPGGLNYGQAMAMATLLLVVCALGILVIERLGGETF